MGSDQPQAWDLDALAADVAEARAGMEASRHRYHRSLILLAAGEWATGDRHGTQARAARRAGIPAQGMNRLAGCETCDPGGRIRELILTTHSRDPDALAALEAALAAPRGFHGR